MHLLYYNNITMSIPRQQSTLSSKDAFQSAQFGRPVSQITFGEPIPHNPNIARNSQIGSVRNNSGFYSFGQHSLMGPIAQSNN